LPPYLNSWKMRETWVRNHHELGLNAYPSPIFYLPDSHFQHIDHFWTLTRSQYDDLSRADEIRFYRAALNTEPCQRSTLMREVIPLHLETIEPLNHPKIVTPYGLPEENWPLMEYWHKNPHGIPANIRMSDEEPYILNPRDVYVHLWITRVTFSRGYWLMNLFLILFGRRGAALEYLWHQKLSPAGRPLLPLHPLRSWPFSVSPHTGFRCKKVKLDQDVLVAYLDYLVEIGHLPLDNTTVLGYLCDWADTILLSTRRNPIVHSRLGSRRREIIDNANEGKPWIKDHYPEIPLLIVCRPHFTPPPRE